MQKVIHLFLTNCGHTYAAGRFNALYDHRSCKKNIYPAAAYEMSHEEIVTMKITDITDITCEPVTSQL
jgi:hypothetical protein